MDHRKEKTIVNEFAKYVIPSMFSMMLAGFYGIVDGFFIGRAMGDDGLAAINLAWPLLVIITATGTGIGTGGAIVMSIHRGAGEHEAAEKAKGNTILLLLIASTVLTVVFMLFVPQLVALLGAKGQVFTYSMEYMNVITYGVLFQAFGMGMTPIMKNIGKPIYAMVIMVLGLTVNVVLDAVLIMLFDMGLMGAALATCIAEGVVAVFGLGMILRTGLQKQWYLPDKQIIARMVRIGLSPFGLTLAPSVVILFTNFQCLNYGGNGAVAAYTVMSYGAYVIYSLMQGLADGVQPILSFCKGADDNAALKQVFGKTVRISAALSVVLAILTLSSRHVFPVIYGVSPDVAAESSVSMLFVAAAIPFVAVTRVMASYLYAVGDSRNSSALVYADPLLFTPIFLLILPLFWSVTGIWAAYPFTQAAVAVLAVVLKKLSDRRTLLPD